MSGYLKLAQRGVHLHPCEGKKPALKDWQNLATTDQETITIWLETYSRFGSPCGPINAYWVLDLDKSKPNYSFPDEDKLPDTLGQKTQSGGEHRFFKWDPKRPIRNTTNLYPGVDVRGEGGYVVIYLEPGLGFIPREGKTKVTLPDDIADAPDWLYDKLLKPEVETNEGVTKEQVPEEELRELLFKLDPRDFKDRESWQQIMRSVHAGSHGEDYGRDAFTEWSLQDDDAWTKDPVAEIYRDWKSYKLDKKNATTWGTIVHIAKEKGALAINTKSPISDTLELAPTGAEVTEASLDLNRNTGAIKPTRGNLDEILSCQNVLGKANKLHNLFVYDSFENMPKMLQVPDFMEDIARPGELIEDNHVLEVATYLSKLYKIEYSKSMMQDMICTAAKRNRQHPVRNYLNSLEWDGTPRLHSWIPDFCGTQRDEYHQAIGEKVLLGAVQRVMEPGSKFDTMLVLEGPQGCRKSSLVKELGKDWYMAPHISFHSLAEGKQDAVTNCFGGWIIEMEEMAAVCNADEAILKKFLTTQKDVLTLKYDKFKSTYPRQGIFVGTINLRGDGKYLRDKSGARRFWPVNVRRTEAHPIDIDKFKGIVDQLWAEAYHVYKKGDVKVYLEGVALLQAKQYQKDRQMEYQGADVIEDWVMNNLKADEDKIHLSTIVRGIWGSLAKKTHSNAVIETMINMGWEHKKSIRIGQTVRSGFIKPEEFDDEID
jgi:predicted P-loop ATPase